MGTIPEYGPAVALDGTELLAGWQNGRQVSISSELLANLAQSLVIGGNQASCMAAEAITAGSFLNVYSSGTTLSMRNALASDPARFANAFAVTDIAYGKSGLTAFTGLNRLINLNAATQLYLSDTTPGGYMTEPPTADGHIVQSFGPAIPGIGIFFSPSAWVLL